MSNFSVVIPTYNESENLPKLIGALETVLEGRLLKIIVVDDNSQDKTVEVAEELNQLYQNIYIHRRPRKLGIGSAISDGIKVALSLPDCEYIITIDADLSHNPNEVPRLLSGAKDADLIQGSRYIEGGRIIGWGFSRRVLSLVGNTLCRLLFRTHIREHTTYLRLYSRKCAETVVKSVHCNGYEWSIASILVAKDGGFRIKEVPITFVDRISGESKLNYVDILKWMTYISKTFVKRALKWHLKQ